MMNRRSLAAAMILTLPALPVASGWAAPELYGRANVSLELVDVPGHSGTELQSNNSRIGLRGSESLGENLEAVYRLEYKVDIDGDSDDTFSRRNQFVGLRSSWGQVIGGYFDTPLKTAQGDVDQFNDLRGDIKRVITSHDDRMANSVMYTTPDNDTPFTANVAYISHEADGRDDGVSASLAYEAGALYAAVAIDSDVEVEGAEVARFVGLYTIDAWELGGFIETVDRPLGGSDNGWLVSARYRLDEQWSLKAQGGASDIVSEGGETLSVGADYRLNSRTRAYGFYTAADNDAGNARDYLGIGMQLNF